MVVALAGASLLGLTPAACFDELPTPTSGDMTDNDSTSETSNAGMSSTTAGTSSGADEVTTDEDPSGTTSPSMTTGELSPWEGLFACLVDTPCDTWELPSCDGDVCPPLDAAGTCVMTRLEARGGNDRLQYKSCEGGCELTGLVLRGATDDRLDRQLVTLDDAEAPVEYGMITRCTLVEPAFFAACIEEFTPACADPANWMIDCGTPESLICRAP